MMSKTATAERPINLRDALRESGILERLQVTSSPSHINSIIVLHLALADRPLAQRLYEILQDRLVTLPGSTRLTFKGDELCRLLPMRPWNRLEEAIRALERAHEALQEVRMLDCVRWSWDGDEITVHYTVDGGYLERVGLGRPATRKAGSP
jgi:hypothetical protein